jgi:hypothetical protein
VARVAVSPELSAWIAARIAHYAAEAAQQMCYRHKLFISLGFVLLVWEGSPVANRPAAAKAPVLNPSLDEKIDIHRPSRRRTG